MSTTGEPALRAEGLVVAYPGGEPVLRALELTLAPGELVCVLGANGAGKSCLLKTLGGLIPPLAGRVRVFGADLARMGARRRAREVASVPQSLRALPDVRVETFVLGGRYPHRRLLSQPDRGDREAVGRALDEADAADFAGRSLHALSGGQMQRVLLARALAQEARVLLFDEPTASLDPEHQVGVFGSLARLVADGAAGRSALVATHELNLASRFATRLLLLGGGGVLGEGPPGEVLCPQRLEPVYGPDLLFLEAPGSPGSPSARVVVPWPRRPPGGPG